MGIIMQSKLTLIKLFLSGLFLLNLTGCNLLNTLNSDKPSGTSSGEASYYADRFHGRTTASGEKYDKNMFEEGYDRVRNFITSPFRDDEDKAMIFGVSVLFAAFLF